MSLNKTLDRLFDEIRREAKRNPDFADRLDAVLQRHDSRRDVPDEVLEAAAQEGVAPAPSRQTPANKKLKSELAVPVAGRAPAAQEAAAPALNPAGLYKKAGEDALTEALVALDLGALRALVAEHNLDPSGVAASLGADELVTHIVAQAKKRAERDDKMFDY
ncbi:MAG: hypothetical protein AB7Q23_09700 [Hyphomonadaceae bacterium]